MSETNFYPCKDIGVKNVSKLRFIAGLEAFNGTVPTYGIFYPVLPIRVFFPDPRTEFFPDPRTEFFHPGSRIKKFRIPDPH